MATRNGTDPDGDGRQSDLAVMDAQEYKQKRRLERILDAHDNVEDQAQRARQAYVTGEIGHDAKNILIQWAVQRAIRETYKLLVDHDRTREDLESDDRTEENAGSEYWRGGGEPLGKIELGAGEEPVIVEGLRDFLTLPEQFTMTRQETVKRAQMAAETEVRQVSRTVPESVSWRAYFRLKEFMDDEHDLEITFEELDDSLPVWGFEEVKDDASD